MEWKYFYWLSDQLFGAHIIKNTCFVTTCCCGLFSLHHSATPRAALHCTLRFWLDWQLTRVMAVAQLSPASSISWSTLKPYSVKSSSSMCCASSCLWSSCSSVSTCCCSRVRPFILKILPEVFDGLGHGGRRSAAHTVPLVVVSCGGQRTCPPRLSEDGGGSRGHQDADSNQSPDTQHPEGGKLREETHEITWSVTVEAPSKQKPFTWNQLLMHILPLMKPPHQ